MQFAFDIIKSQPHLIAQFNTVGTESRMHTRSNNPDRTQFNMFRPSKTKTEKSISYAMRRAWNALPLEAHKFEDKNALSNYLLAINMLLEF